MSLEYPVSAAIDLQLYETELPPNEIVSIIVSSLTTDAENNYAYMFNIKFHLAQKSIIFIFSTADQN